MLFNWGEHFVTWGGASPDKESNGNQPGHALSCKEPIAVGCRLCLLLFAFYLYVTCWKSEKTQSVCYLHWWEEGNREEGSIFEAFHGWWNDFKYTLMTNFAAFIPDFLCPKKSWQQRSIGETVSAATAVVALKRRSVSIDASGAWRNLRRYRKRDSYGDLVLVPKVGWLLGQTNSAIFSSSWHSTIFRRYYRCHKEHGELR